MTGAKILAMIGPVTGFGDEDTLFVANPEWRKPGSGRVDSEKPVAYWKGPIGPRRYKTARQLPNPSPNAAQLPPATPTQSPWLEARRLYGAVRVSIGGPINIAGHQAHVRSPS